MVAGIGLALSGIHIHVHMCTYIYKCIYSYLIRTYVMMLQVCHSFMFQMYSNSFRILPLGLLLIKFSDEQMGTAEYLWPYLLLYGVSRGLWEDMNNKVLSEHLESTTDPASASGGFAMVTFISGISAAAGYFSFAFVPPHKVESFIFWSALVSVCVFLGYRVMSGYCKNLSVYNSKMKTGKKKTKTRGSSSNGKSKSKKNSLRPAVNDYENGNEFTVP